MDEKDLPSCSDDSDVDFVPKDEEEYNSDSGSEVSDCEDSEGEDKTTKGRKRRKGSKKANKKPKINKNEDSEEVNETEEKKIDVDALWADFKKDVNNTENKRESSKSETESGNKSTESLETSVQKSTAVKKTISVPSVPNRNRGGGLSSVLNKIGKKDKMSTLQKSQLDWNKFKKSEGIEEEIKLYNKGKDGYLDKQDFLQRTDLRQFEIEKDLRTARRKF